MPMTYLFEEGDIVLEELIKTPGILDAKPMERVLNWTTMPLLILADLDRQK